MTSTAPAYEIFNFSNLNGNDTITSCNYITKCFFPLTNGDHAYFVKDKITGKEEIKIMDQPTIKKVYFNRLPDNVNSFYFKSHNSLRTIVCELNKPVLYDEKINICPAIKANAKPYKEFDTKINSTTNVVNRSSFHEGTKKAVDLFLKYVMEVLASNNEDSYNYILNWISNMLKGNKNDACIYLKGGQGIGKSTISDFLKEFVIGVDLFLETGSAPLKKNFNKILEGKLLVQFTELENMNKNEWACCSSALKRIITSSTILIEGKNENSYQVANINNYIIDSNNDAIKDDEGRRYFIADVSPKYQNDRVYFGRIRKECFNDEVGNAFYSLMLERNTDGFIPQNYPETKNKLHSHTKRLDTAYQFVKDEFILKKMEMKSKPKDLYDDYLTYCKMKNCSRIHAKNDFMIKLSEVMIDYKKTNGNNWFKYSYEELQKIADKQKWIHELDLEEMNEVEEPEKDEKDERDETIARLLKEVEELKRLLQQKEEIKIVIEEEEETDDEKEIKGECVVVFDDVEEEEEEFYTATESDYQDGVREEEEEEEEEKKEEVEEEEEEDILGLYFE